MKIISKARYIISGENLRTKGDEFKRIATLMVSTDTRHYEYIILYGENAQRSIPII